MQSKDFSARLVTTSPTVRAPDVAAARAEEAKALREIEVSLDPQSKSVILDALRGTSADGFAYVVKGKTQAWEERYQRFYAAHTLRRNEERREASIAAARKRGGVHVVVALAAPPSGTVAAVLRRQARFPADVIVLGPNATAETFGGAFAALDQSRELYGDDLIHDLVIGLEGVQATAMSDSYRQRLERLMIRLQNAPSRAIEGVGNAKAIDLRSLKLRAAPNR